MDLEQQIRNKKAQRAQNLHDTFLTKSQPTTSPKQLAELRARQILNDNPDSMTKAEAINVLALLDKDEIIKGKPGAEGEIREWGGKKYKKVGKEWKEVGKGTDGKKKEGDTKGDKKPAKDDKGGESKPAGEANPVDKHEIAQLTHLKEVMESDPDKAYEIYQSLSPEAQSAVPQEVTNKLVQNSHTAKEDDAKAVFDGKATDEKPPEEKLSEPRQELLDALEEDFHGEYNGDIDDWLENGLSMNTESMEIALEKIREDEGDDGADEAMDSLIDKLVEKRAAELKETAKKKLAKSAEKKEKDLAKEHKTYKKDPKESDDAFVERILAGEEKKQSDATKKADKKADKAGNKEWTPERAAENEKDNFSKENMKQVNDILALGDKATPKQMEQLQSKIKEMSDNNRTYDGGQKMHALQIKMWDQQDKIKEKSTTDKKAKDDKKSDKVKKSLDILLN